MSDASASESAPSAAAVPPPADGTRSPWRRAGLFLITLALLSPVAAWLLIDWLTDGDGTLGTMVLLGTLSAAALAAFCLLWVYSGWTWRARLGTTAAAAAAVGGLWFLFPPQWNGAMQISGFRYRFAPNAEERVAAFVAANPEAPTAARQAADAPPLGAGPDDWPGFRGPGRDGKKLDAAIPTNWGEDLPETVWRHPVGLGWGGFSVVDDRCFTLEQRGDEETVACYDADSGAPLWTHGEPARFPRIAPNGGDGPASTPLFHEGAVYSMGSTGLVTCLDARTGALRWKRELIPSGENIQWGLACSPLVVDGALVVLPGAAAGSGSAFMGLDPATGETLWASGDDDGSYSSPVTAEVDGVRQILAFGATALHGLTVDGAPLWEIPWTNQAEVNAALPIVVGDRVFLSSGYGKGAGLFKVAGADGDWRTEEDWRTENRFKLKFNDAILHEGFVYGLDEGILSCVEYSTGKRMWKRGRYGYGQCLLLGTADGPPVLLITCEDGDLALVAPSPDGFDELTRYSEAAGETLLSGVCWNHAAYSRGRLFWRNGAEAVCIRLADEPAPSEPAPSEPAPSEPAPSEPAPSEPAPSEPAPSEPAPSEPAPSEPAPSEPAPSEPAPSEPAPSEPAPDEATN